MSDEPHTTDSLDELRHLPREVMPDAALEERTIAALRARSLLRSRWSARRVTAFGWLLAAGVAVVVFGTGLLTGRLGYGAPTPEPTFALMLYGGTTGSDSADHAQRADEYRRWVHDDHAWGRIIGGEALGDPVGDLPGADTSVVNAPERDELVGFFLIDAPDRQAAARLAAECPHLKYGGRVVVRQIQPT
jgi:hypothetical protein